MMNSTKPSGKSTSNINKDNKAGEPEGGVMASNGKHQIASKMENRTAEIGHVGVGNSFPYLSPLGQVRNWGTREAFQKSMLVSGYYRGANWVKDHKSLTNQFLGYHKASALRESALFDTYIGAYGGRKPRFNLHYILNIDLRVLYHFLSRLRRADYLIEQGKRTEVVTTPKSIYFPFRSEAEGPIVHINLSHLTFSDVCMPVFNANGAAYRLTRERILPLLDVVDDEGDTSDLGAYIGGSKAPNYNDISKRYYGDDPSKIALD